MFTFSKKNKKENSANNNSLHNDESFNALRKKEFARLDEQNQIYLDFTGGNLYPQSILDQHYNLLKQNVLGNPHSTNPTSQLATNLVDKARKDVLQFFNADDYYCIFTSNASGALKIVGECYPFMENTEFALLADNHNSVNGIREYCRGRGGSFEYLPIQFEDLRMDEEAVEKKLTSSSCTNKLFAFPAQSNVTGVKHNLKWIKTAQENGWDVLLDAAAFVPTSKLDLKVHQPDFVSVSFYKIFGYPTGLGCLLVRKDKFDKLQKHWFAGGTVSLVSVATANHFLMNNHERFENGTVDYLGLPALTFGLDFIENIGIDNIQLRVTSLISYLKKELESLKHTNGNPLVKIFGPKDENDRGGTLVLNFFNASGEKYSFENIESLTNQKNISIRSGCFCNPGIDEINNCITTDELAQYFTSRDNGDYKDMMAVLNKMRGATRVSVGIATVKADLDSFISFVSELKDVG